MPIQFRCPHCHQRLSAPTRKSGQRLTCPKCHESIAVPVAKGTENESASHQPSSPPPAAGKPSDAIAQPAPSNAPAPDAPVTVAPPSEAPQVLSFPLAGSATRGSDPGRWIGVSRQAVFLQGVLLVVVAIIFFVLGMSIGRQASGPRRTAPEGPVDLRGSVSYRSDGRERPDSGAVIILLPKDARPAEKLPADGLRPGEPKPSDLHPSVAAIRRWGGDYVRSDASGRFHLRAPHGGEFFLLVISAHADRNGKRPELEHLAQIGRFFLPAVDLLGERAYEWRTIRARGTRDINRIVVNGRR